MSKQITMPESGIVLLVGPSNSGKTTLLNKLMVQGQLLRSEIVSSDQFRVLVADMEFIDLGKRPKDEQEVLYAKYQLITQKAFAAMRDLIEARCALGKLTVVDATHLWPEDRKSYVTLAQKNNVQIIAVALDIAEQTLLARDEQREFSRGKNRIKQQVRAFKNNLRSLRTEGFDASFVLNESEVEYCNFVRADNSLAKEVGSGLDFIGDVHGCYIELIELLEKLGYEEGDDGLYRHSAGRKLVSVGDILGRGPQSIDCLKFFKNHVDKGLAYMVDSNHGWKIARWLDGRQVELSHGDEKVAQEFAAYQAEHGQAATAKLRESLKQFLLDAPSHLIFKKNDIGVVVAAHAGIKDEHIGKRSNRISDFCRYGETDGFADSGKPVRLDWFINHQSGELIIWGHDPKPQPLVLNNTVNIDQGVVFGGRLTAFRYPEKEFVAVEARTEYSGDPDNPLQQWNKARFNPPNIQSFLNGYSVLTDLYGEIKVQGELAKAAIEEISRYTVPIEELVYIPPTMSPAPDTSPLSDYLEHPREAFKYYRSQGINTMVVEKKHMGSRAILLLFKNREAAKAYVGRPSLGTIYTRTGRAFFTQEATEEILEQLNTDLNKANYFAGYNTDFVLLDAEILPWNLKAKELISSQYAHVAEAALLDRQKLAEKLILAQQNGWAVDPWLNELNEKIANANTFREVFQNYCWDTDGTAGIQIAPFHILAHSGKTFFNKPHLWHMQQNKELAELSALFMETEYKVVTDEYSEEEAVRWWLEMTDAGHEGFVVKPEYFAARNEKGGLIQPAIKVRGQKYLHIIYGIDYLLPENLQRLKQRNVSRKQRKALMEFALGVESVERFIKKEALARIHEGVLGTLALEAEPVDPRL